MMIAYAIFAIKIAYGRRLVIHIKWLLVMMLACMLSMGCMCNNRHPHHLDIVGHWKWFKGSGDETISMTFHSDGSVVATIFGTLLRGTFSLTDGTSVVCEWETDGGIETFILDGDQLLVDGSYPMILKRINK